MNFYILFSFFLCLSFIECQVKSPYRLSPVVRRVIQTKNAPGAIGPYNQAIQVDDTLYVSGNIGLDPSTGGLVPGGIGAEAIQGILF